MNKKTSPGSPFGGCFRPTADESRRGPPPPPPPLPARPNLATCLYQTDLGLFSLTWSRSLLGRALDLHLHHSDDRAAAYPPSLSSFNLRIEPFLFWRKNGSRKLHSQPHANNASTTVQVYWDLTRAKFGSGPEPESGFYIGVVVGGEMKLLVGDSADRAYGKAKAHGPSPGQTRSLVLRREHVICGGAYSTRARFGGKWRGITVNCGTREDPRLRMSVEGKRVLEVKRLKWKFRGNETIVVDGVQIQVSWDVYNWLFDDATDSHAVFMFRFEDQVEEIGAEAAVRSPPCRFGISGVEARKMRRRVQRPASASAISPVSSAASVMEWATTEEADRLNGPTGFSLVVYAWKK